MTPDEHGGKQMADPTVGESKEGQDTQKLAALVELERQEERGEV